MNGYRETERKLKEHIDKLHAIAQYLFENEKMDGETFRKMMEGIAIPPIGSELPEGV